MRKIAVRGRTLGDGPNVDPQVHSRARLRMDVQSSTCVVLPRCLGKPNRYGPKVLDAMLLKIGHSQLMHELLVTLMAEVTGIVNSRPIAHNTFWHRRTTAPNSRHASYYEDLATCAYAWSIRSPRPLHAELVEKGPVPGRSVLGEMEKGVPAKPSEETQVNDPWMQCVCWRQCISKGRQCTLKRLVIRQDRRNYKEFGWQGMEGQSEDM